MGKSQHITSVLEAIYFNGVRIYSKWHVCVHMYWRCFTLYYFENTNLFVLKNRIVPNITTVLSMTIWSKEPGNNRNTFLFTTNLGSEVVIFQRKFKFWRFSFTMLIVIIVKSYLIQVITLMNDSIFRIYIDCHNAIIKHNNIHFDGQYI